MSELTIVKFGSELVTLDVGVNQANINRYATGLSGEYPAGELVVVTSGAVKAGRKLVEENGRDAGDFEPTTLAQLGSPVVMRAWQGAFRREGRLAGELLVTHNELGDKTEGPMFSGALEASLRSGVVPIVNENDALSDKELMKLQMAADNDGLASHVAKMLNANFLRIFTADGGVFDDEGRLIDLVDNTNVEDVYEMLRSRMPAEKTNGDGRGGILEKFEAVRRAAEVGIHATIEAFYADESKRKTTAVVLG